MFFSTGKTLKVEIESPKVVIKHEHKHTETTKKLQDNRFDLSIKIITAIYVLFNISLAIMGYSNLTGNLETLGISTNELDFSLSTLLFQGYTTVILEGYNSAGNSPISSAIIVLISACTISAFPAFILFKHTPVFNRIMVTVILATILSTLPIIPVFGLAAGEERAQLTFEKLNGFYPSKGIRPELTITTKDNITITGTPIFMSDKYSYIMNTNKVYKIMNRDNHLVSVTDLVTPTTAKAQVP